MLTAIAQSNDWSSSLKKKVSLVTNEGGVTSFQRSLLSFHSPMLARSVGKHGRGNKKDDRNKQNPFPGWCWGLARQVGMPPDCQWAFPQAKAHWFASLRCSATERQTLTTVLLIRWYNIWTCFYIGMCCCLHISQKPGTQRSPMGDEVGASPNLAPNLI